MMVREDKKSGTRYETGGSSIWLDEEGIIRAAVKPVPEITVESIKQDMAIYKKLGGGSPRPVLANISHIVKVGRDARHLAATQIPQFATAAAVVIGSPVSRVIGNFFLGLNRPEIPLRLFDEEEAALAWLRSFLD
ncbi:MAG: hypothetical protein OEY93_04640 [Anaerolineae bacterium]|nr:hypothetical protein [Anaerolineae bacterium]